MTNKKLSLILVMLSTMAVTNTQACTKPVFRYALERWDEAPYRLTVLNKGPLDEDTATMLKSLRPEDVYGLLIDVANVEDELQEGAVRDHWLENPDPKRLPLALLQTPKRDGRKRTVIWEGPIDTSGINRLKQLLYSPLALDVVRRISSGDTAVWLIIKGSDGKADTALHNRLKKELAALESTLKLPHELDPDDSTYDDDLAPGVPMRTGFSILEVEADAPEAELFKRCLAAWDPELMKEDTAVVVPIFARARALAAFRPEELTEEVLKEVCYFLVGPCSCRVKELNPGFDLCIPAPWDRLLWDESFDVNAALKKFSTAKPDIGKEKGAQ